jgi:hypothetical protein
MSALRTTKRTARLAALLALLLVLPLSPRLLAELAQAQSGGPYNLTWSTSDGGGAMFSAGGSYSLGGTIAQPDAGAALSGGTYTVVGGFWQCFTPDAVTGVVIARLDASDAQLTWSGADVYDVWRSTDPYFDAGDPGSLQIGDDVTSPFTASGVLGAPAVNYYFIVLAQDACGASGPSNRTGEFDFDLAPGSP